MREPSDNARKQRKTGSAPERTAAAWNDFRKYRKIRGILGKLNRRKNASPAPLATLRGRFFNPLGPHR